jgi:hypothetical protein
MEVGAEEVIVVSWCWEVDSWDVWLCIGLDRSKPGRLFRGLMFLTLLAPNHREEEIDFVVAVV